MAFDQRRAMYACDVTYGTNSEFGFDYLRDNMAVTLEGTVQKGHTYAIVDEVDSILIDEARTPLIISGEPETAAKTYYDFARVVKQLEGVPYLPPSKIEKRAEPDADYTYDEKFKTVSPLPRGIEKVERALGIENLYDPRNVQLVNHLSQALKAQALYNRDKEYVIADGEVKIVDEFTGRIMEGRRWSEGLHQAVEAKENVTIQEEHVTMATITLQNYFRLYDKLAGMTGTAKTEEKEFSEIYGLHVAEIPTNVEVARDDGNDLIYRTKEAKFAAAVDDIAERHEEGQPVLVGTIAVETSEYLSQLLTRRGIPHNVLNAKQHEREAEIIAQAGRKGSVTIATNMAGRGVDIVLGGNKQHELRGQLVAEGLEEGDAEFDAELKRRMEDAREEWEADHEEVLDLGGLYVVGTERHEARRIDNQLRGRSGRQGDPGETRFFLSGADDLVRLFAGDRIQNIMARFKVPEDQPMEAGILTKQIENAQKKVEEQNFVMRKNVLKYDDVMNKQRTVIYEQRRAVLEGQDLSDEVHQWIEEVDRGHRRPVRDRRRRGLGSRPGLRGDAHALRLGRLGSRAARGLLRFVRPAGARRRLLGGRAGGVRGEGAAARVGASTRARALRDPPGRRHAVARAPREHGLPARGRAPAGQLCPSCRVSLRRIPLPLCERCGAPTAWPVRRCGECAGRRLAFASARAAIVYDDAARALVRSWKERGLRGLASVAAELVVESVARPDVAALVAVPPDPDRGLERGEHPATALARELGRRWSIPLSSPIARSGARPRQAGLALAARRGNVRGTFLATAEAPASVCLVDDVYTSGETVNAAASALRKAGARRVAVVSLARAVR